MEVTGRREVADEFGEKKGALVCALSWVTVRWMGFTWRGLGAQEASAQACGIFSLTDGSDRRVARSLKGGRKGIPVTRLLS